MTVLQMIEEKLRALGADGLVNTEIECGCHIEDLTACGHVAPESCRAARRAEPPEWAKAEGATTWFVPLEDLDHDTSE